MLCEDRTEVSELSEKFLAFAMHAGALRFGEFKTKAGRLSPYFFNAGQFNSGALLGRLAEFYAKTLLAADLEFDVLFGPAYKGIPLAAATAVALAQLGRDTPFSFNRKEAKDHGEGGSIVGAALSGRVMIIDDVITDGASKRESVEIIRAAGATPVGVVIALDRMERGQGSLSAVQEFEREAGIPVISIANLDDLMATLEKPAADAQNRHRREAIERYREQFGSIAHAQ
jgi:orotate phosphoribosyltransferase